MKPGAFILKTFPFPLPEQPDYQQVQPSLPWELYSSHSCPFSFEAPTPLTWVLPKSPDLGVSKLQLTIPLAASFCTSYKLRIVFTFIMIIKIKRVIIFQDMKLYEIHIPVFINKVLLEHRHAHSFMYCLWLL